MFFFLNFSFTFLHSTAVLYTHSCVEGLLCRCGKPTFPNERVVVESDNVNCAKVCEMQCSWLLPVAEHVASNLGVKIVERVVTHGAPITAVLDFQSSLYRVSSSQSHFWIPTFTTVNLFSQGFRATSNNAGLNLLRTLRASVQVFHVWRGASRLKKGFALDSNFHSKRLSVCTLLIPSFCIDNVIVHRGARRIFCRGGGATYGS